MISVIFAFLLLYYVAGAEEKISQSLFEEFKAKYRKDYSSKEEEKHRLGIFMSNMVKAREMNRANPYAEFGVTKFADLTNEEFLPTHANEEKYIKAKHLSKPSDKDVITYTQEEVASSCTAIDWRKKGAVTAVKDQGQCGSAWAFSATAAIESQWFIANHSLVSLSVQEFVSCDNIDYGCHGGMLDNAFPWLIDNHKGQIVKETSLPYASGKGNVPPCPANISKMTVGAQIKGYRDLPHDEAQMATFVCNNGPLSISISARSWILYKGGIMTNCIKEQINHNALIVGLDRNNNPPYWIIKNSWGDDWGEDGYIRVAYGSDQCMLVYFPITPIIGVPVPTTSTPEPAYTFVHSGCSDKTCSKNCVNRTLPVNTCVPTYNNRSWIWSCSSELLITTHYYTTNCTGKSHIEYKPVNLCIEQEPIYYYKNYCIRSSDYHERN